MRQAADVLATPARTRISPTRPSPRTSRSLARLLLALGALLPLGCSYGVSHAAAITAAPAAVPGMIAAGPDGGVWFAERNRPRLGRIGADGVVSEFVLPFTIGNGALIAAPDGALWAAVGNQVARITTDGLTRMLHVPSAFESGGHKGAPKALGPIGELAAGPLATVWYTIPSTDSFGFITTGGRSSTGYLGAQTYVSGITTAHFATWLGVGVASKPGAGAAIVPGGVVKYTLAPELTTDLTEPFHQAFYTGNDRITSPAQMGVGPDRNAWFLQGPAPQNLSGPARLSRITADGQVTDYPLPAGQHPGRFVAGPDSAIWFTLRGESRIAKLTMDGKARTYPLPQGSGAAAGITAGTDGNLWLSLPTSRQIGRLSPGGTVTLFQIPA